MKKTILLVSFIFPLFLFSQINRYSKPTPRNYESTKYDYNNLYQAIDVLEGLKKKKEEEAFKKRYKGKVHLYGGVSSHDTYLGCLNCENSDELSIWNSMGVYGKKNYYSPLSKTKNVWNSNSKFGNTDWSNISPWSRSAKKPPAIVDFEGFFYGYFTSNKYKDKRTHVDFFKYITDNYDLIKDNYQKFGSLFDEDGSFDVDTWNRFLPSDKVSTFSDISLNQSVSSASTKNTLSSNSKIVSVYEDSPIKISTEIKLKRNL